MQLTVVQPDLKTSACTSLLCPLWHSPSSPGSVSPLVGVSLDVGFRWPEEVQGHLVSERAVCRSTSSWITEILSVRDVCFANGVWMVTKLAAGSHWELSRSGCRPKGACKKTIASILATSPICIPTSAAIMRPSSPHLLWDRLERRTALGQQWYHGRST